jgi:uncharacterized protein YraI
MKRLEMTKLKCCVLAAALLASASAAQAEMKTILTSDIWLVTSGTDKDI